jgi:predicted O-methyltransferase YrrM
MYYEKAQGYFNYLAFYERVAQMLPDNAVIAEVGVYKGCSALYLAERLQQLGKRVTFYLVDHFEGSEGITDTPEQIWKDFNANIEPMRDAFKVMRSASVPTAKLFPDGSLDFVFIDAEHDYESVKADIQAWKPKVKSGGFLAGHDYHHAPLRKAVDEALPNITEYEGTCWGIVV